MIRRYPVRYPGYPSGAMPIYEFACDECGTRFEELVDVGTTSVACRNCGSRRTHRRYSAQAAGFQLVKSPGEARKQEARNAELRKRTKADFKARRKAAREARARAGGRGG
jgi:putative FmdB family regulatory protein